MASIRDTIRDVLLNIDGSSQGAEDAIARVEAGLEGLDGKEAQATVELARTQFDEEIARVNAKLDELGARDVKPKVKLKLDTMRADVEMAAKDAEAAFSRYFQPKFNMGRQSGIIGDVERLAGALPSLSGILKDVGSSAEGMGQELEKGGFSMGDLAGKTRDLQELAMAFVIVVVASMIPAILALAGSLASAIAGAGALAVAFAGALAPALAGAIAVFTRFTAILQVAKELQLANRNATHEGAVESQRAAAAVRAHHAALLAIKNALEGVQTAEQAYADAVRQAEKQIADARKAEKQAAQTREKTLIDANRSEGDAHRRVLAAQKAVKAAVSDAYHHWLDLIDKVKHDQLDLEGAQLGVLDAQDALNKAQAGYNSLLNEIPADKLGDVLQKLNDVSLPEDQVKGFITAAMGPDADPAFATKLYDSHLKLLHAQHDLKVATLGVADATKQLNGDQKELNSLTTKGIAAYGPYTAAVAALKTAKRDENRILADNKRAIADATAKLHEARAALKTYEREGVHGQEAVRNAARGVRDAQARLAEAHWQAAHAAKAAAGGASDMSSAASRLKHDLAALSPAERDVLYALVGRDGKGGLKGAFRSAFGTDAVMSAVAAAVRGIAGLLKTLSPELRTLSGVFALVLGSFAKALTSKGAISFFKSMINLAGQLTLLGGGALRNFIAALAQIAKLAAPGLAKVFEAIGGAMARFLGATKSAGAQKTVNGLIDSFLTWGHALRQIVTGIGGLLIKMAPFGNQLVKWLGNGAEALGKWAGSKSGTDAIGRFFHDTLPLAKSVATFVWNLGKGLANLFQFIAPILQPIVQAFSDALGFLSDIFGWLNKVIPRPIRELLGIFGTMVTFGPKLLGWLGKIPGILGTIAKFIGSLGIVDVIAHGLEDAGAAVGDAAKAVGEAIWKGIKAALTAGLDVVKWIADAVSTALSTAVDIAGKIADWLLKGLKGYLSIGADVLGWIFDSLKAAVGAAGDAAGAVAKWIKDGLSGALDFGEKILGWIGDSLVSAVVAAAKGVSKGASAIATWITAGLKAAVNFGGKVLSWIGSSIIGAAKGVWSGAKHVGTWLWNGIKGGIHIGSEVVNWLVHGLENVGGKIIGVGAKIARWIGKGLAGIGKSIVGLVVDALNWIISKYNAVAGWATGNIGKIDNPFGKGGGTDQTGTSTGAAGVFNQLPKPPKKKKKGKSRFTLGADDEDMAGGIMDSLAPALATGLTAAVAASVPTVVASGPERSTAFHRAPAEPHPHRGGEQHDHLHVHGHTKKVDPDPRTTRTIEENYRRKKGSRR